MIDYEHLLFKKSLIKNYIRREIPLPQNTKLERPIFITGSSRSGTSILAKALGESPRICHFTENIVVRRHMWHMVENRTTLEKKISRLEKTIARLSGLRNSQRVLEKTPGLSLLAKPLANHFLDAQFIHIVRDGRDVAFSMLKHNWIVDELRGKNKVFWFDLLPKTYQHQWKECDLWKRGVLRWAVYVSNARKISNNDRYLEVKYNKLCQEPDAVIDNTLKFLELPSCPKIEKQIKAIKSHKAKTWKEKNLEAEKINFYQEVVEYFQLTNL